jgi:hypothetical protein
MIHFLLPEVSATVPSTGPTAARAQDLSSQPSAHASDQTIFSGVRNLLQPQGANCVMVLVDPFDVKDFGASFA